jgi:twinkle protein
MTYSKPEGLTVIDSKNRGILPETFAKYGCGITQQGDLYLPYYSIDGRLIGAKIKKQGVKDFRFEGDSSEVALFGVQTANGNRHIIITEGELDALAANQMTGYPAVSVPHGADSAVKHCKKCLKFLESFENIYVVMDNDEPGQRAQEKLMQLFKPGKARAVTLPMGQKDSNDMLVSGQSQLFKNQLFAGRFYLPVGITTKDDLVNRAVDLYINRDKLVGLPTGYTGLDTLVGGWRPGELHVVAAGTGIGKSSLVRNLAYRYSPVGKVLYIPLEDMVEVSSLLFAEMRLGCSLVRQNSVDNETLQSTLSDVLENILVYDQRGSVGVDELCDAISYVVREHDVKFVVLDHITAMADGLDLDERKALDACMKRLKFDIASALSVTVVVVSHLSRDSSDKEDNIPNLSRLKGASSIAQYADTVFGVSRKRDSSLMTIKTLKGNRVWGQWGEFTLEWCETTRQLVECSQQLDDTSELLDDTEDSTLPFQLREGDSTTIPTVGVRESELRIQTTSDTSLLQDGLESSSDGITNRVQGSPDSGRPEEDGVSTITKSRKRNRTPLPA